MNSNKTKSTNRAINTKLKKMNRSGSKRIMPKNKSNKNNSREKICKARTQNNTKCNFKVKPEGGNKYCKKHIP